MSNGKLFSYIDYTKIQIDEKSKQELLFVYEKYINHEFDLLGSGWIKNQYGMPVKGFRGNRYVTDRYNYLKPIFMTKVMKKLSSNYVPINWFIDYKSGFFFHPAIYNNTERCLSVVEEKKGVEIKCPWELGRFYHLVQLSILAIFAPEKRENIIKEFKNEIYDFVVLNPIGKTVQWSCVMDVSIRNVNLLIAYDLLKQLDTNKILDAKFEESFRKLIFRSTKYIIDNLEYVGERQINANHYLSNLAGVAFGAAYLPETGETDAWLTFAVQEMIEQVNRQFFDDGSNFEGSTSYHRLSTEFVLYTTALVYGVLQTERKCAFTQYDAGSVARLKSTKRQKYSILSEQFFPQWYLERLYKAGVFTETIMKNNDEVVQIGDNDSGHLIKLSPLLKYKSDKSSLEENVLDHSGLLSGLKGLYNTERFTYYKMKCPLEYSFIQALAHGRIQNSNGMSVKVNVHANDIEEVFKELKYHKRTILYQEESDCPLNVNGDVYFYDKFGVWVYRNERVFVSMSIPPKESPVINSHRHNDALAVEIMVDKQYITRDSGSYIYTSAPDIRDKFRSVQAHNTICVDNVEQNNFQGIFGLKYRTKGKLIFCRDGVTISKAEYGDIEHVRIIRINADSIVAEDYCNHPFTVAFKNTKYSTGYGKMVKKGIQIR